MKIGILTHYTVNNQGAQLQLAAMCEFLRQLGHTPVVLTYEKNLILIVVSKKRTPDHSSRCLIM